MKGFRKYGLAAILILALLLSTSVCFAGGLSLESSSPEAGSNSTTLQNVAVKLRFNEPISAESTQQANAGCFSMQDSEGNALTLTPTYDAKKYPNEVWLIVKEELTSKTEYSVQIDASMVSDAGNTLGSTETIVFQSRNTSHDNNINMLLMVVMMGAILVFGVFDTKRQVRKAMEMKGEVESVNPYKEAKRTGRSVEDIVAKTEKEKARIARKYGAYQQKLESRAEQEVFSDQDDVKRVSRRGSVKAHGGRISPSVLAKSRELASVSRAIRDENARVEAREKAQKNKNKKKK